MTKPARDFHHQMVHYLRKAISVPTNPSGVQVEVGTIPANAIVLGAGTGLYVGTDLNGTTNVLNVGFTADSLGAATTNAYASSMSLPITTGGHYTALDELANAGARPRAVDTNIVATWTGTATTGEFTVIIAYMPNR